MIFKMLPHKPPYKLAMDRTNWQFGETDINVLTLAIVYQNVAFPILMLMLDKRGNSDTQERIDIVNRYIKLFGRETIDCLLADREFVGGKWIASLNLCKIPYYIRIKENFYVQDPRTGNKMKASVMFADLKCGEYRCLHRIYRVNRQLCYSSTGSLTVLRLQKKKEKTENRNCKSLFLTTIVRHFDRLSDRKLTNRPEKSKKSYRER